MKRTQFYFFILFLIFSQSATIHAAENEKFIVGQPIPFTIEEAEGVEITEVTAIIVNKDIEFRFYFEGKLTWFSFFNPPLGNKVKIFGKPTEEVNDTGVLTIKYPLEEFKKYGSITIKFINEYSLDRSIYLKPRQIQYHNLPSTYKFDDENLMDVIKETLKTDIVYSTDLKKITWLKANNKNISNLTGLEQLTELKHLDLGDNKIEDITILGSLTKLEYLNLENNQIEDISGLQSLSNLTYLNLKNNIIKSVNILKQLKNVKELFLHNNPISDYRVLTDTYKKLISNDFNEQMIGMFIKDGQFKDINLIKDNETHVINYTVNKFKDIPLGAWYTKNVAYLVAMGIIDGYSDDSFKPNGTVTIDQFIKLVISALGYNIEKGTEYWAQPYIDKAIDLKIINDNEFINYRRQITRGEIAMIVARIIGNTSTSQDFEKYKSEIADFESIPDIYKEQVLLSYSKGIISGYPDKTFRYNETASRAGATSIIVRIIDQTARVNN